MEEIKDNLGVCKRIMEPASSYSNKFTLSFIKINHGKHQDGMYMKYDSELGSWPIKMNTQGVNIVDFNEGLSGIEKGHIQMYFPLKKSLTVAEGICKLVWLHQHETHKIEGFYLPAPKSRFLQKDSPMQNFCGSICTTLLIVSYSCQLKDLDITKPTGGNGKT